ncbi:MAG: ABC transporter permease [Chloroflexota bacterium]
MAGREPLAAVLRRSTRRNAWTLSLAGLVIVLLAFTRLIRPTFGAFDLETLAIAALPLALAAVAQAAAVIAGGIDLSVGSMIAVTNVTAAVLMKDASTEVTVAVALGVLVLGLALGTVNGLVVVLSRVPDIVVTLAMLYVWGGVALLILPSQGGGAPDWLKRLVMGGFLVDELPKALIVLAVVVAVIWLPFRHTKLGLALYAVGSDRLAAFRCGVDVGRTKVASYALCGLFSGAAGLALTAATGIGTPTVGAYTLAGVAAIVLGGVNLAGGRGGVVGPIIAAHILSLIRTDLVFLGVDPNYSTMIQGGIMVLVVMVAGLLTLRRRRT